MRRESFTLVELIVVLIIIGILGAIAIPAFLVTQERARDNEAKANLRLIIAAERIYRMEQNVYYFSTAPNEQNINANLRLSLPVTNPMDWNYVTMAGGGGSDCCAQAARNGADGRKWRLRNTEEDPVAAACP